MKTSETINVTREESVKKRKELKKEGWISAHYCTRHGWNVDVLRAKAKKGMIRSIIICTDGGMTTWYYLNSEIEKMKVYYG